MKKQLSALVACALAVLAPAARAQWLTQSLDLKAGWNAVYLHVDASHATLDQLVGAGAPVITPIEQVWRWDPDPATAQFIDSPQEPVDVGSQWTSWKRADGGSSRLQRLSANIACLVYSTVDYTWELKGRPVLPAYQWSSDGLNFLGFPTVTVSPPSLEAFLTEAPSLLLGEIFSYPGGALGPNNPGRVFALRTKPVRRGEAFWMRAGEVYNNYYGPLEVTAAGSGDVSFGGSLSTFSFRLRNLTAGPLTVSLRMIASETPPAGQTPVAGVPPLLVRGPLNPTNLTHGYFPLPPGTNHVLTLAPAGRDGSDVQTVIGLDRAAITAGVGDLLAGVLQFTESSGRTRVDLGVSATAASSAGLWVGGAAITQVSQYLQQYLRDTAGRLVVETNGAYVVTGVITNLTPVPAPFPLKLIVHNPAAGPATLWQRIHYGLNVISNAVVANEEASLDPAQRAGARRLSATHLPWTEANPGWNFSGPLARGAVVVTRVTNAFDRHESNPFLHTYHPDHDNLNPTFRSEVPQGSESYTIVREITLSVRPPADDFDARTAAGLNFTGDYLETIRVIGLARAGNTFDTRRFDVRGAFSLGRLTDIATVTRVP
ncbi:MAG: hypothetical protein ACKVYV_16550 [Limisphaerales bacterium]